MDDQLVEKKPGAALPPQGAGMMPPQSVIHSTFVIRKRYPKPVAKVFAAFADPAKKRRWYAEREPNAVDVFEMDFRVGGRALLQYRLGASTPFPGAIIINTAHFVDIVPDSRIVEASTMAFGERRFSAALITVEFLESANGCELVFTHQGAFFEGSDGPELREKGWQHLLAGLDGEVLG